MIDIKAGETIQELVCKHSIRESGYFSLDEIFAKLERLIELMS